MDDEFYDSPWSSFAFTSTSTAFNTILSTTQASLDRHAISLRDHLDTRSQPNYEIEEQNAKIGTLRECKWHHLKTKSLPSILIKLTYERATYRFVILSPSKATAPALLLAKAPTPLIHKIQSFLVTKFDVSSTPLKLPSSIIQSILEEYLSRLSSPQCSPGLSQSVLGTLKITLSSSTPVAPHLRSMDIDIPAQTVHQLVTLATKNDVPFLSEVARHIHGKTGMKLPVTTSEQDEEGESEGVMRISRISCSAFAISTEGRVKVFSRAVDEAMEDERTVREANEMILLSFARETSRRRNGG